MSMFLSDLESWGIVFRQTQQDTTEQDSTSSSQDSNARIYKAQEDFFSMIIRSLTNARARTDILNVAFFTRSKTPSTYCNATPKAFTSKHDFSGSKSESTFEYIFCSNDHSLAHLQQILKHLRLQTQQKSPQTQK